MRTSTGVAVLVPSVVKMFRKSRLPIANATPSKRYFPRMLLVRTKSAESTINKVKDQHYNLPAS